MAAQQQEQNQQKLEKNQLAKEYNKDLSLQEMAKRQRLYGDKQQDKMYAQLELAQQEKSEQSRKWFFDHMKGFQDKNDAKTAALMNFMQGRDLASLSKQDEERMLKAVEEKNMRDRKNDDEKNMRMNNMKNDNLNVLRQQMLEK